MRISDWSSDVCSSDLVIHDLAQLELDIAPAAAGVRVVVSGHSHKPVVEERGGVLYVNPGSSGPRRFKLPISAGELIVDGNSVSARVEIGRASGRERVCPYG